MKWIINEFQVYRSQRNIRRGEGKEGGGKKGGEGGREGKREVEEETE